MRVVHFGLLLKPQPVFRLGPGYGGAWRTEWTAHPIMPGRLQPTIPKREARISLFGIIWSETAGLSNGGPALRIVGSHFPHPRGNSDRKSVVSGKSVELG